VQILWINLITDSLPVLGLGTEPPQKDVMRRKPRRIDQPLIAWHRGGVMLLHAVLMATAALIAFATFYQDNRANTPAARTAAFCVLSFSQLLYSLSCRSLNVPFLALGFFANPRLLLGVGFGMALQIAVISLPFARPIFRTDAALGLAGWCFVAFLSLFPAALIETFRYLSYRWRKV
jgi:Ca2+-transporting ATPase